MGVLRRSGDHSSQDLPRVQEPELEKIQDLVLLPGERFIAPNIKSSEGYEIVAPTDEGEWLIGLFGKNLGRWGGIHPRLRARLIALREKILR